MDNFEFAINSLKNNKILILFKECTKENIKLEIRLSNDNFSVAKKYYNKNNELKKTKSLKCTTAQSIFEKRYYIGATELKHYIFNLFKDGYNIEEGN